MNLKLIALSLSLASATFTMATEAPQKSQKKQIQSNKGTTRKGLFTVVKADKDWFFEIPDSLLGKLILAVTRYTSTPGMSALYGGEKVNEQTVYWEKKDKRLYLRSYILLNYANPYDQVSQAIEQSNENPIIGSFEIEPSSKKGVSKIKVTNFFLADNPALSLPDKIRKQFALGGLAFDGCYIDDIKTFPINTEVKTVKTYNSSGSGLPTTLLTGKATFGLNISFIRLPEKPMQQRLFDPRVGYFSDSYIEYADNQQRVRNNRFIVRWRLEPKPEDIEKMKSGELVEPQKPIVYYIDPATPKQWRKYLIQGINDWQVAFEQAGFKNAIMGKEWPENDSTMSMEDARFSIIRYFASPIENAYGPQVHDPRTGEILESHIGWYHNIASLLHDWYFIQAAVSDTAGQKMYYDEELMGNLLRFVAAHEVGHTLGLRHNFGSSSTVPVEKLRDKAWVEAHGHTPSIMDYARFNYVAQPEDSIGRVGLFPRIGDYDRWAIQWGYQPTFNSYDGLSDRWEREKMVEDSLKNNKRLWFGDGETNRVRDPRCQTEDLSNNVMVANAYGIKNLKRIIKQLPSWTYEYNDIYNTNTKQMHANVVGQFKRYLRHVINYIGGTYANFQVAGNTQPVYSPVSKAKQKEALDFLNIHILNEPKWLYEEPYVLQFESRPEEIALNTGKFALQMMLAGSFLEQLHTDYNAESYLNDLLNNLFSELKGNKKISSYRREMQKMAIQQLVNYFKQSKTTKDTRAIVYEVLKEKQKQIKSAEKIYTDTASRLHLSELNHLIEEALIIK